MHRIHGRNTVNGRTSAAPHTRMSEASISTWAMDARTMAAELSTAYRNRHHDYCAHHKAVPGRRCTQSLPAQRRGRGGSQDGLWKDGGWGSIARHQQAIEARRRSPYSHRAEARRTKKRCAGHNRTLTCVWLPPLKSHRKATPQTAHKPTSPPELHNAGQSHLHGNAAPR